MAMSDVKHEFREWTETKNDFVSIF